MRAKPLVVPNRSRKLLPRLVMVDVEDTVELITDGVGDGVGVGIGVGVGLGDVVGAGDGDGDCACAADIAPTASSNATAIRRSQPRQTPNLRIREARDEQRIIFIPEKSARSKKCAKLPASRSRFAPSLYGASIAYDRHQGLNTAIVVRRPQVAWLVRYYRRLQATALQPTISSNSG